MPNTQKIEVGQIWEPMGHMKKRDDVEVTWLEKDRVGILRAGVSMSFTIGNLRGHYRPKGNLHTPTTPNIRDRIAKTMKQKTRRKLSDVAPGQVWMRKERFSPVVINRMEGLSCFVQPLEHKKGSARSEREISIVTLMSSYKLMFATVLEYNESKKPTTPESEKGPIETAVVEVAHVQAPYASQEQLDALKIAFATMMTDIMMTTAEACVSQVQKTVEAGLQHHLRSEQFKALIYDAINNALK